ncbi:MFS transporter [Arthrobacter bambusae]|uniref:MFS transporter n=1 Tax=Arthrobacter bambusae TaxID=1338426 RepID=UPI002783C027|nr:MFS transporter [Arthrobacter bambusae]MDQ0028722.1 MFS family permease [Arthrobacter bambusae]MDQ0096484.1 MFS family permease [Arthrobacter bambusae]
MTQPISPPLPATRRNTDGSTGIRMPRAVGFVAMSGALLAFFAAAGAPTPLLPIYEAEWKFAPSMLTFAFGVYALAMIVSLLVVGSLSDYIGRRPVLSGALALELASVVVFLFAPSIEWIVIGRVLQGLATGVASSTFGAAIVELAPEGRKRLGAIMSSLATTTGLGVGALFSGLVALAIPKQAGTTVWIVFIVLTAAGTVLAFLTPETSTRRAGALRSLIPRMSIPGIVRRLFAATSPTIIAVFLETAFFLGLVPTVLAAVFGVTTPIIGGLINFVMFTAATAAAAFTGSVHPHRLKIWGNLGIAIGAVLFLGAIPNGALWLVWASAIVSGAGTGAAFSGSSRGLVPEVEPHQRAGLFAAFFTIAYLAFGGSAIIAGLIAAATGVTAMAVGFSITMAGVALTGLVLSIGLLARRPRDHRN